MKKCTFSLLVLFICMITNAQVRLSSQPLSSSPEATSHSVENSVLIPDESVPVGYCSTVNTDEYGEVSTGVFAEYAAAIQLPASMFENKGNKIFAVRFALKSASVKDVKIFFTKELGGEFFFSQDVENVKSGWNYVVLSTPYEITSGDFYAGYSFTGSSIAVEDADNMNRKADFIAVDGEWINASEANLGKVINAIQVMVMGGNYSGQSSQPVYDASIEDLQIKSYVKKGTPADLSCMVVNNGITTLKKFDIVCQVENGIQTLNVSDVAVPNGASYTVDLPAPTLTEEGIYPVKVYVSNLNDGKKDAVAENDTLVKNVKCLDNFYERKSLFELFTGQDCGYCPSGHAVAEISMKGLEDRIIWVSHHAGYAPDDLTIEADEKYASFFGIRGAPNCMMDRSVKPLNQSKPSFDPRETSRSLFKDFLEIPTYVTVNIDASFDDATRLLTVTVSGDMIKELPKAKLNLFLTQSGYEGKQSDGGMYLRNYIHNDFMREVISELYGDDIEVVDNRYTKTYTYIIPGKIGSVKTDLSKMTLVAFVADYVAGKRLQCGVHNVEKFDLSTLSTGIGGVGREEPVTVYVGGDRLIHVVGTYDSIDVYSSNGVLVKNVSATDTFGLDNGFYIIRIVNGGKETVKKIVI